MVDAAAVEVALETPNSHLQLVTVVVQLKILAVAVPLETTNYHLQSVMVVAQAKKVAAMGQVQSPLAVTLALSMAAVETCLKVLVTMTQMVMVGQMMMRHLPADLILTPTVMEMVMVFLMIKIPAPLTPMTVARKVTLMAMAFSMVRMLVPRIPLTLVPKVTVMVMAF